MTAPALALPARGEVFVGTPEQILTTIHALYRSRIENFIYTRLPRRDWHLAEDIASEVFLSLWRYDVSRGKPINDDVYGLLCMLARQGICHHLRRKRSHEAAIDFTDPAATVARTAAAPAATVPHLAWLLADLERAKEQLTEACARYKTANRAAANARTGLRNAVRPKSIERATARAERLTATADAALANFRSAANRVSRLRAAWNEAADATPVLAVAR